MDYHSSHQRARGIFARRVRPDSRPADRVVDQEKRGARPRCRRPECPEFPDFVVSLVGAFLDFRGTFRMPDHSAGVPASRSCRVGGLRSPRRYQGQQRRKLSIPADDPVFQLTAEERWTRCTRCPIPVKTSQAIVPARAARSVAVISEWQSFPISVAASPARTSGEDETSTTI